VNTLHQGDDDDDDDDDDDSNNNNSTWSRILTQGSEEKTLARRWPEIEREPT
jgi:hypothetical protein